MRTEHGSARFAKVGDLEKAGHIGQDGQPLGYMMDHEAKQFCPISYCGDQHIFTSAKNRSGKGTSAIIPALMEHEGGAVVIDVKGENALITAFWRKCQGHNVQILDGWDLVFSEDEEYTHGCTKAGLNPMDILTIDSPNLVDDARAIADTLIIESGGDSHWSTEAKNALATFIGYVATAEEEEGQRHLPRVRDLLTQQDADLIRTLEKILQSPVDFVAKGGNILQQKSEKERQSVMSTANANTHFLDSPAVRNILQESTFDFADLKNDENPLTVYVVIPAERLNTHSRLLRAIVSNALQSVTRSTRKPKKEALFVLDEFAALGRLKVVEDAYGLMAGYGVKIWAILQDLSQAQDLYKQRWATMIANAGVVQIFGISDLNTAEYFSRMFGKMTGEKLSAETKINRAGIFGFGANPEHLDSQDQLYARELMTPDELMQLGDNEQILIFNGLPPARASKVPYFYNRRYYYDANNRSKGFWGKFGLIGKPKWKPMFRPHPNFPNTPKEPANWDSGGKASLPLPRWVWRSAVGALAVVGLSALLFGSQVSAYVYKGFIAGGGKQVQTMGQPFCHLLTSGYQSIADEHGGRTSDLRFVTDKFTMQSEELTGRSKFQKGDLIRLIGDKKFVRLSDGLTFKYEALHNTQALFIPCLGWNT